jgi:peptidyl-tRNA hydrolase, PTH1 family
VASPPLCVERTVRLVVGLGNPGSRYADTRHNVGFMLVDRLAQRHGTTVSKKQCSGLIGFAELSGEKLCLAKPQTYMNLSGDTVGCLMRYYKVPISGLLVVYDDRDLPMGRLRLREGGSAGGHRGIESIIAVLGTQQFPRLRIGIGRPSEVDAVDHVLGRFSPEERQTVATMLDRAADAVEVALRDGLVRAMNDFNG